MRKSFSFAASAAAFFIVLGGLPAAAESIQQSITADVCPDARLLNNEIVFERAIVGNGVTFVQSERNDLGLFATNTVALFERYGVNPPERGEDLARYNLAWAVRDFVDPRDNPAIRGRTQVTITPAAPSDIRDRMIQFLSLTAGWLEVRCVPPPARPTLWAGLGNVRIARDLEGAREGDVGDPSGRTFATLAGRDDRETGEQTFSFEGLALFGTDWKPFTNAEVETYIGYHRTSSSDDAADDINDLTFGAQVAFSLEGYTNTRQRFSILPSEHFFDIALSWETDDEFESGVTRVELAYDPMWGGTYGNEIRIGNCLGAECSWDVTGVVDFAEVGDPGEKAGLLDMEQYGRIGVDLEVGYYVEAFAGEISLTGDYRIREAFTDDGDAERFTARLAYTPGDSGRISIGLDYVDGEDLTSFEAEEYLAISIGFRN